MQMGRVEDTLTIAVNLLKEIQDYVAHSLHDIVAETGVNQVVKGPPLTRSSFELYLATNKDEELLCGHALLNLDWDKRNSAPAQSDAEPEVKLFSCGCPSTPESPSPTHTERLKSFSR
jgi:hypothetical protein